MNLRLLGSWTIRGCADSWIFGSIDFQHFESSRADVAHAAFYISKCFDIKHEYLNSFLILLFLSKMVKRNYYLKHY